MEHLWAAFTHRHRSSPCCPHLHAECVSLVLQQRGFAAQLHVEVGGVRSEAEILSEVNRQGSVTYLGQTGPKRSQSLVLRLFV